MILRDRLLKYARVYRSFQNLISRRDSRARIASEFIVARPGERILDIGCADCAILNYLPDVEYTGLDHNPRYIKRAEQQFGNRGRFVLGDASMSGASIEGRFDKILILSALHHLSDEQCRETLEFARNHLTPTGSLISIDPVLIENQNPIARWLARNDRGRFVRDVQGYIRVLTSAQFVCEYRVVSDLLIVPYTNLIVTCKLPRSVKDERGE
jgi:SAM-dependent methyltransferase